MKRRLNCSHGERVYHFYLFVRIYLTLGKKKIEKQFEKKISFSINFKIKQFIVCQTRLMDNNLLVSLKSLESITFIHSFVFLVQNCKVNDNLLCVLEFLSVLHRTVLSMYLIIPVKYKLMIALIVEFS